MSEKDGVKRDASGAQTVERALSLLKLVSDDSRPVPIGTLCEKTGLNRTTAYRLLSTMENCGFLERDPATKGYRLGYAASSMGMGAVKQYAPLVRAAEPVMRDLLEETQETIYLAVARYSGMLTIDQIDSRQAVRLKSYLDEVSPFYCSSNGKVYLSHLSDQEVAEILSAPLPRRTSHTVVDPEAIMADIRRVRKSGFAIVVSELDENESGISVAIHDKGTAVAFLSVAGPTFRLTKDKMLKLSPRLKEAAEEISRKLRP